MQTRRRFAALTGGVALGGIAGCLDDAAPEDPDDDEPIADDPEDPDDDPMDPDDEPEDPEDPDDDPEDPDDDPEDDEAGV